MSIRWLFLEEVESNPHIGLCGWFLENSIDIIKKIDNKSKDKLVWQVLVNNIALELTFNSRNDAKIWCETSF